MEFYILNKNNKTTSLNLSNVNKNDLDIKKPLVLYCDIKESDYISEFIVEKKLFNYYFFVSNSLKSLFEIYDESIEFIPYFFTDIKMTQQVVYWRMVLNENDYLIDKNIDSLENVNLKKVLVSNKHIFLVKFNKQEYVCVSLILAENMLRKLFLGIRYFKICKFIF